jgi:hypothetical protein
VRAHNNAGVNDRQQARLAVIAGVLLYIALPPRLTFGPIWVAPALVGVFLIPLVAMKPTKIKDRRWLRYLSTGTIAALNFFNIVSVVELINILLNSHARGHADLSGGELIRYGAQVWMINILVFALWFWEVDGSGPFERDRQLSACDFAQPDFLFPQMSVDQTRVRGIPKSWKPMFLDYLYVSFTNALAVSPTDTMPLTRTAKMLMLVESLISFITVALILARSVNILS